MLNAFNAHSIFELTPKDRFRIDSLLAYGDKLILGLSTGALRVYRVNSPDSPDVSLELLQTVETFARRKIEILACIKEAGILVSLSDGNVHIHDLADFSLVETLGKARGASALAVTSNVERDPETQIPSIVSKLAIGVRRKLLMYSWDDGGFQEGKEVTLSNQVRSLTWASGNKIVVGLDSGFVIVDVETATVEEISPSAAVMAAAAESTANGKGGVAGKGAAGKGPGADAAAGAAGWGSYFAMGGWGSKSLSTRLAGEELLLVKDSSTLFINTDGKPLDKQPIPWSTPPDAIAYSYPYLVSLNLAKHQIEVRNPATRTRLQTISLPAVATLHVPPPNVSLVHAGKLFFVASPTQVWRMGATDYEVQINELIQAEHLDEAIRLIETLESVLLKESKEEKLREVQMLKAQRLFEKKKYEESMTLFASVSAPPERVIKLFPSVIAGDISIWPDEDEDGHVSGEEGEEGDEEEEETAQEGSSDTAASTLGFETIAEEEEEHSPKSKGASDHGENGETPDAKAGTKNDSSSSSGEVTPIEKPKSRPVTPELKRADTFITMRNSAFSRKYSDTASIFSFGSRKANTLADDASMLSKKESQIVDDTPKPLEGDELKKGAQELARTYLNDVRRKLTKYFDREGKAVDPLSILASGSIHEASKKDPLEASFLMLDDPSDEVADPVQQRIEKLMETCRLVDTTLFRAYMLIRPALVGPLVRIQNHCDPDVVKEKLRDTGKYDDLVDFLERKQLHRDALELLRFFGQADEENKAPNLHGPQRTVTYLERLKSEHIELILEFSTWPLKADSALGMEVFIGDTGNSEMLPRPQVADFLEAQDQRLAILYLEHIITELHDQTPEFHTRLAGLYLRILTQTTLTNAQKESWHTRFLGFLEASDQYRAEKVLGQLPRDADDFLEPRAVVLSKMGRHKAALEIYVFRLHNDDKAEDYCSRVHAAEPDADVFHILLSLYLRPPSPYDPQLAPALGILSRHGARLDASEALELIPATVVVRDLETYFETRIRAANARVTGNRMLAALRKSHLVDVQERLLGARNKHATVGDENVCPVCHKRLGMSVLWRLPSGVVVHYGCAKKAAF